MTPKRLEIEVKTNGHSYTLFRRSEKVACYKQYFEDTLVGFELFIIPIRKEETIKNVTYPLREVFPSTSVWGENAWTLPAFTPEDKVIERFNKLDKEVSNG